MTACISSRVSSPLKSTVKSDPLLQKLRKHDPVRGRGSANESDQLNFTPQTPNLRLLMEEFQRKDFLHELSCRSCRTPDISQLLAPKISTAKRCFSLPAWQTDLFEALSTCGAIPKVIYIQSEL